MNALPRGLRVFLCHSSGDKELVRPLYNRLHERGFQPWLDEINLIPGQYWKKEILKAVRESDVVLICLSCNSVNKGGYVQKEIKFALDVADEQPEGTIYLIPVKLEDCSLPERLSDWQWVNLYHESGFEKLIQSLERCTETLGISRSSSSVASGDRNSQHSPDPASENGPAPPVGLATQIQAGSQHQFNSPERKPGPEASVGANDPAILQTFIPTLGPAEMGPRPGQASFWEPSQSEPGYQSHGAITAEGTHSLTKPNARERKRRILVLLISSVLLLTALVIGAIWISSKSSNAALSRAAVTHYNLGLALSNQQRFPDAEAEFKEAISLTPNNATAHSELGRALGNQGKHDEAEAEFRQAIRIDPNNAISHNELGVALYQQGRYEEAEAEQRSAIRIDPTYAPAHYNLGGALASQRKNDEAVIAFKEAIRLNPTNVYALNDLGMVLGNQGKDAEAQDAFTAAINISPKYASAHNGMGTSFFNQKKYAAAEEEYNKAIKADVNFAPAYYNLGRILINRREYAEAEAKLKQALMLNPSYANDAAFHHNLGLALAKQEKHTKAEEEFRAVINLRRDDAVAHYNLGITLERQLRYAEAESEFREALRLDPNSLPSRSRLNELRNKKKKPM